MFRVIAVLALICCIFSCQVKDVSFSEAQNPCTREILQAKVEAYIDALKKGEPSLMPLAPGAKYIENRKEAPFEEGVWREPLVVDFYRSLLDTELCETYTEIISASGSHPYVIGTRLKITGDRIAEVEALVTDDDDWRISAMKMAGPTPTYSGWKTGRCATSTP